MKNSILQSETEQIQSVKTHVLTSYEYLDIWTKNRYEQIRWGLRDHYLIDCAKWNNCFLSITHWWAKLPFSHTHPIDSHLLTLTQRSKNTFSHKHTYTHSSRILGLCCQAETFIRVLEGGPSLETAVPVKTHTAGHYTLRRSRLPC